MELTSRQQEILESVVSEYINLAQPISSHYVDEKYDFGVSPATIRNEFLALSEKGYLAQPHTSAGRVPTDKGYRFLVDRLMKENQELKEFERVAKKPKEDPIVLLQELSRELSLATSLMAAASWHRLLWKEGWESLFVQPEFEERQTLLNFTRFVEDFEKNVERVSLTTTVSISIGRENRFSKMKDFSIMMTEFRSPESDTILVALLGPKRMAYDKNMQLLQSLGAEFSHHARRKAH